MSLYYIKHVPTQRLYTPNNGTFRAGRNWRKNKAVLFTDANEAQTEVDRIIDLHRSGQEKLRIRTYGGYDTAWNEVAVGDGFIRDRDFRVCEI